MSIQLFAEPSTSPLSWEEFRAQKPARSIALDGYVLGMPRFDAEGPHANFNHHEQVARLETRSTCAQVLMAIRQGLFETFHEQGRKSAQLFVNDCDEDVCLSVFLLQHPHLVTHAINPVLNRLVSIEDMLDTTAGSYPFPADLPTLEAVAWVFEPYRRFRTSGRIDAKDADDYRSVITDVGGRIQAMLVGSGQSIPLEMGYRVLRQGRGWSMVEEEGAQARTAMFSDGIRAFVSVRERPDGGWVYSVGRMSQFIPFPVLDILAALNTQEATPDDPWGGSETIAGSPRVAGSRLDPDQVFEIVEASLRTPCGAAA